jgi:sugar phosphate isomerase/epimerase
MNRRDFITTTLVSGLAAITKGSAFGKSAHSAEAGRTFKLKYAPHLGMFKNHAGDDPVNQLRFIADQGFTAFEDNDMSGRKEPTTGEINYRNVLKHIHDKGYTGLLGMEHGNSKPGKEGEQALINAYIEVDSF